MDNPQIGIIMGSDSDLPALQEAAKTLEEFGVPYEMSVCSAHRTPEAAHKYATTAKERGLKVIIAAAGGAAHLAGVMAGNTTLPVIGIPIKSEALSGMDSLLSTVQMPSGIPVATVAINGSKNAGLLAVQILATADENLAQKLVDYKTKMAESVMAKSAKLQEVGYKKYLESK